MKLEGDRWHLDDGRTVQVAEHDASDFDVSVQMGRPWIFRTRRARIHLSDPDQVLSIVWGTGTYSTNREAWSAGFTERPATVEVAVIGEAGDVGEPLAGVTSAELAGILEALGVLAATTTDAAP